MPFRQLPNTLISRVNVLSATNAKVDSTSQDKLILNEATILRLKSVYTSFRKELGEKHELLSKQANLSAKEDIQQEILKRIVSHFIQVFNFGIERGQYPVSDRAYFGMDVNQSELPNLQAEQGLITWSNNLIDGEPKRTQEGGSKLMQNPEIKEIEIELNKFQDIRNQQSTEKDAFDKENKDVLNMLPEVDDLIRDIYDEVEFHYRKETPSNKRKLAREWGIIYVSRKGEAPEEGAIVEEELYKAEIV